VHPLLELAFPHLAVCDQDAQPRNELLEPGGGLVDRLDPVVEEERLALARMLALQAAFTSSSSYSPT
jgi:hypothetical protein